MVRNAHRLAAGAADESAPNEQQIVERIFVAVMDQRLPPGAKLGEAALCDSFGVGRMRVRRALLLLANQGIVDLRSNRGAFVARPSRQDARDVFGARLALEPGVVRQVAREGADLDPLDRHLALERQAHLSRNRREAIRLSGEFHVTLAAATGNAVLTRMMRELVTRSSLIIGLFGGAGVASCREGEHLAILSALREGDDRAAVSSIRAHLGRIEAGLDLTATDAAEPDLRAILATS